MSAERPFALVSASALAFAVSGCAGGNATYVGGITSSPGTPTPTAASVSIFSNPSPGQFGSVGASAMASDFTNLGSPLGAVSTAAANQPLIRYTADGNYQIEFPGGAVNGFVWHTLRPYGQGTASTVLTDDTGDLLLALSGAKDKGYRYTELASWRWGGLPDMIGAFAFGTPTPDGGVPVSGTASYSGIVAGKSDVIASDPFDGPNRAQVGGTVNLDFNFATGALGGSMSIGLYDAAQGPLSIGTFAFKDTVFSVGSTSYSGKFDTTAVGQNGFLGRFSGPAAEETLGAWMLPFVLDVGNTTITADHKVHQAFGAWIAKKP